MGERERIELNHSTQLADIERRLSKLEKLVEAKK